MEKLGPRRSEMTEMRNPGQGMVRLTFRIPARASSGYRSEFLTIPGAPHHASRLLRLRARGRAAGRRKRGVLWPIVSAVVAFALGKPAGAAQMFVSPGDQVTRA